MNRRNTTDFFGVVLMMFMGCLVFLAGCAATQPPPNRPTVTLKNSELPPPVSVKDSKEQLNQLVLGYGDKITIDIFNQEKLSSTLTVDPSGVMILPLVGDVLVANRDVLALRKELTERYARYIRDPQVIIRVESISSQKYAVLGEVGNVGVFPITMPIPISEAIAKAGGIGSEGQAGSVLLVRRTDAGGTVTEINMASIQSAGNFAADLQIKNGDIIFVPKKELSVTAEFMSKIGEILVPILSVERAIVLWPSMLDVLSGEESSTDVILGN